MTYRNRDSVSTTSPDGQSVGALGRGKGYGLFAGRLNSSGAYEPTVIALIVMIILEVAAYVALRYTFKTVHGG